MQNSKLISIIIVNYRSERYLDGCIASIYRQLPIGSFEIIVVNNDDASELGGLRQRYPEVKLVNLGHNPGFGKANNIGVKKTQGRHFLFLNPDTEIIRADLSAIFSVMADEKIGLVGPKIVDMQGNHQEWSLGYREIDLLDLVINNLGLQKRGWHKIFAKKDVHWVSGAALLVSRELFLKIGGFDENFFLYFEDVDLCKTIRNHGKKIHHSADIIVKHVGGGSQPDKVKQKQDFYRSQDYYFKKHFGYIQAMIVKGLRKIFI